MPKKPTKIIIKFSNDSTANKDKKGKGKPKKSGPSNTESSRANGGTRKLRP